MVGIAGDQKLFISILQQHNPKVYNKLIELGLDPTIFTVQWFVCLYTHTLDFEVLFFFFKMYLILFNFKKKIVKLIFDYLMTKGSIVLF